MLQWRAEALQMSWNEIREWLVAAGTDCAVVVAPCIGVAREWQRRPALPRNSAR